MATDGKLLENLKKYNFWKLHCTMDELGAAKNLKMFSLVLGWNFLMKSINFDTN